MSIVLYEAIKDELRSLEETDLVRFSDPPHIGSTVAIGSNRRWSVVEVETYQSNNKTVYLAFIHPENAAVPDYSEWALKEMKEWAPDISFDVQLWQEQRVLSSGWNMDGSPPTGRLYGSKPTNHPTLMQREPLPWSIDEIDTYKPISTGSYTAIHICHCKPASLPEVAVA